MNAADDDMTDDEAAEAYMAALADLERDPLRERIAELEAALIITTTTLRDCVRSLRRCEGGK